MLFSILKLTSQNLPIQSMLMTGVISGVVRQSETPSLIKKSGPSQNLRLVVFPSVINHPLHCPICAKDIMITVLLLQVMGGWEGWGVVHLC